MFAYDFPLDPDMEYLVDSLTFDAEKNLLIVIAETDGPINRGDAASNRVGQIVTDAMIMATGADASIVNMGGVRAEMPSGNITKKDVFAVMPFDNKIVSVKLSGADIAAVIERMAGKYGGALVGGVNVEYNPEKPEGERIRKLTLKDGTKVEPDKEYTMATNDYVFYSYTIPQFLNAPKEKTDYTGIMLRTAMEEWMKKNSPVKSAADNRWTKVSN
jgi:2',3'-cyclic-nucleotide 2'-phosphodiesterase (5'-nucleotidase family)